MERYYQRQGGRERGSGKAFELSLQGWKMKIDEKGNVEWYSRQSVQHEGGMETGKQGTLELFNLA